MTKLKVSREAIRGEISKLRYQRTLLETHCLNIKRQLPAWLSFRYTYCRKGNCKCTKGHPHGPFAYIYFKSKKEVLSEVIKLVNHALRSNSWDYTKGFKDRREIENAGIQAFFHQFKNMGKDYRIVREAEFVDKTIGTWYYTRIASSYAKGLEEGIRSGAIIDVDSETLAYILMGISHTVGIDWFVLNENKTLSKNPVLSVLEFIMHGLKGILKEE